MLKRFLLIAMGLGLITAMPPAFAEVEDVVVEDAWSRASIGTSRPGVAYMALHNEGDTPVVLTDVQTDIAAMPMIHATVTDDQGVAQMMHQDEVEIAAGESVAFTPGGLHVMLMGLQRPLVEGESYSLSLIFSDGSEIAVEVPILAFGASGPEE